jgi:hypothetical protein
MPHPQLLGSTAAASGVLRSTNFFMVMLFQNLSSAIFQAFFQKKLGMLVL